MAQTSIPAAGEFRVGRVFQTATAVFTRNFAKFFIFTLVPALPFLLAYPLVAGLTTNNVPEVGWAWFFIGIVVIILLFIVLSIMAQAAIIYGAFLDMRGRQVDLGESLSKGLSRFLPIVGLAILFWLGIFLGAMLLVVPGIILAVMWSVATPACVLERLGPVRSLGRSRELTRGYRWRVFGAVILLWVIIWIVSMILSVVVRSIAGDVVEAIVNLIWSVLYGTYFSIMTAVMYRDLRIAKEGIDIEQIAAVFD